MGMGLAICRSIVDAHNGRLWASPNLPCGAVFQFTLPADQSGGIDQAWGTQARFLSIHGQVDHVP